jgi:hypothetical protein
MKRRVLIVSLVILATIGIVPSVLAQDSVTTTTITPMENSPIRIPIFGVQFLNQIDNPGNRAVIGPRVGPAFKTTQSIVINFKVVDLTTGDNFVNQPYVSIFKYNGENQAVDVLYGYDYLPFSFNSATKDYQLTIETTNFSSDTYVAYVVIRTFDGQIVSPLNIRFTIADK